MHRGVYIHTTIGLLSSERLLERAVKPALVLVVDEAVGEDTLALVLPPGVQMYYLR